MTDPVIHTDRLVIFLHGYRREPTGYPDVEQLIVDLGVKNPIGSPGAARRPPAMEVRDGQGRVFELQPDDNWLRLLEPGEEMEASPLFEISTDATGLTLVLAPGTDEEAQVELLPEEV